ncbi:MAG: hypothetical protein ACOVNL_01230 [Prochlorococcaceae cyanobacterium]
MALTIVAGIVLRALFPPFATSVASLAFARINLLIVLLSSGMIDTMMPAVDFRSITRLRRQPKGPVATVHWLCVSGVLLPWDTLISAVGLFVALALRLAGWPACCRSWWRRLGAIQAPLF